MKAFLDFISEQANCNYISDLPRVYKKQLNKEIIKQIPYDKFTLKSWNDAIQYLTKKENEFASISDAKNYFLKMLE